MLSDLDIFQPQSIQTIGYEIQTTQDAALPLMQDSKATVKISDNSAQERTVLGSFVVRSGVVMKSDANNNAALIQNREMELISGTFFPDSGSYKS